MIGHSGKQQRYTDNKGIIVGSGKNSGIEYSEYDTRRAVSQGAMDQKSSEEVLKGVRINDENAMESIALGELDQDVCIDINVGNPVEDQSTDPSTFGKIEQRVRKSMCQSPGSALHGQDEDQITRKVLSSISLLISVYAVTALPYVLISIYWIINPNYVNNMNLSVKNIIFFISYSNSAINPFIYGNIFKKKSPHRMN